jgi:hypothetical protein
MFSAYKFDKGDDLQWLKERFKKMKDMLEDNWAYREMVQWAEEKALKQGLEQGKQQEKKDLEQIVVRFVELHFPDLAPLAKQQTTLATTPQQLQEMLDILFVVCTDNEAKAALLGNQA